MQCPLALTRLSGAPVVGNRARMRPATEMSLVSIVIPAGFANRWIIGRSEYVAVPVLVGCWWGWGWDFV